MTPKPVWSRRFVAAARRTALAAVMVAPILAAPSPSSAATVVLRAYDEAGTLLSTSAFLARTSVAPKGWRNDLTYRIADGTAVAHLPIVDAGGLPSFDVPEAGMGLSVAWSTAGSGYSTLFLDDLGTGLDGGTMVFNERAALDVRAKLDDALARRPAYVPSAAFTAALADADAGIVDAGTAATEPERAVLYQQALDDTVRAFELLLAEYGRQRARATDVGEWWGVTVDRVSEYATVVDSIANLVENAAGRARVRIVFDEGVAATNYDTIVAAAQAAGLEVVGEILDSYAMSLYSLPAFQARVQEYVDHFPTIDVWEIGNEVNGEWLGPDVAAKIAWAADYVKTQDPGDTTMLTFYWQMGTAAGAATSLFQWIDDHVDASLRADVDVVALSAWIGDAPLGVAHDEVFERLHALFPAQRIVMGELGYWSPGTTKAWWWRSETDPTGAVRRAVAEQMYLANLSFDYADGGVFWWYYFDEMRDRGALWQTVNEAYRSIHLCDDADADAVCDFQDNCTGLSNPDQADSDGDGLGDVCDLACPDGEQTVLAKMQLDFVAGPGDRLKIKAWAEASQAIDPATDGIALRIDNGSTALLDVTLGGPGAPVAFEESRGSFRYRDSDGSVAGISTALLKPVRGSPGLWLFKLRGRALDVPDPAVADGRVLLDFTSTCSETHADVTVCELYATRFVCY